MSRYAANTSVTPDKSRAEIEATLTRYGASAFGYMREEGQSMVTFRCNDRVVRFVLSMPDPRDAEFSKTPAKRRERSPEAAYKAWQQACRQRWRALALVVKAKLEAVEAGISEFEEEFLPHIVLPDGRTVGEWMLPQVRRAYELNEMPKMLVGLPPAPDDIEEAEVVE